jgi:pimeloyl-ACP methyl ester carboxylesterase
VQEQTESAVATSGAAFQENYVDADGFHIRYLEAGQGDPLICLHGAGGVRVSHAHSLLAEQYRVILFEVPGFGHSPVNDRSTSMRDLARTIAEAASALGLDQFNLLGNSFGGRLALWLALEVPERIQALVLAAPAAILPENRPRIAAPESQAQLMYAHPERQPPRPPLDPAVIAKQDALVSRLRGPNRDPNLESRLGDLNVPVLVLFGTKDRMIPPEMGRIYREQLPNCHYILVYDAGHAIDADRPEALASVVRDFLQRHESFVVNQTSALINP